MLARVATVANQNDLAHYFEYSKSGLQVLEDGLKEVPFGEFMVERAAIDRFQLFRALQMQDKYPGVRLGECAAALGYLPIGEVERLYDQWRGVTTVEVA
ncbi:MAG: hypothetical protein HS111_14765 [Kofleriaceae bacterium]|nr:hypothetical protein [Kofleriaceae bacterium]MCL4225494.1 hypothetical protein [Myxococcales bacterium]